MTVRGSRNMPRVVTGVLHLTREGKRVPILIESGAKTETETGARGCANSEARETGSKPKREPKSKPDRQLSRKE